MAAPARRRTAEETAEVAGVRLTHPDRVLWPAQGATKLALARYWESAAGRALPHLAGRPLVLLRCPSGRQGACFIQRHAGAGLPKAVRRVAIPDIEGKPSEHLVADDLAAVVALVQVGVLELHVWGARADAVERPDRLVLDLDPAEGVAWSDTVAAAREARERLAAAGLASFVKTTGGKGLHVVAPVAGSDWPRLKDFAEALARGMEGDAPDRYLATASKEKREGRIYVDWLRNARSASFVAPHSPRAKPGAPVSTPLAWEDLSSRTTPDHFTLDTMPARLDRPDPWAEFFEVEQALPKT